MWKFDRTRFLAVRRWALVPVLFAGVIAASIPGSLTHGQTAESIAPEAPAASMVTNPLQPTFQTTERLAGFSTDSRHYIYLESSRDTGAGIPKSRLQVLNVATNACTTNGCLETQFSEAAAATELSAAENQLLQQTSELRQALQLTAPAAGTELDIVGRSRTAYGSETVQVRLPNRDQPLQLRLAQRRVASPLQGGTAEQDQAAMQLEIAGQGQPRLLGSLTEYRSWVLDYSIREVHLSPDGQRIAVLVTMTKPTFEGTLGTTLVQGFEL